jgi:1-deoxy-D-xylulose-5-phosphate synthase
LIGEVARHARCVVTVEEGSRIGGFGAGVLEALSEMGIVVPTKVLALPDWYIEQGPQDLLREKYGLTADGIYEGTKALLTRVDSGILEARAREEEYSFSPEMRHEALGDDQGS